MNSTQTKVTFIYDESFRRWEVEVSGVESPLEALQAFNAVVITAQDATPNVDCNKAIPINTPNTYRISIGV